MGKEIEKVLEAFAKKVNADAKLNLSSKNSSGRLSSSLKSRGGSVENSIAFIMQDYGPWVDQGRDGTEKRQRNKSSIFWTGGNRGDEPPVDAIAKWTKQKGIQPDNGQSIESLAYVISKSIAEKGIKGSMFFTKAWNKHYPKLAEDIYDAYLEEYEVDIEGVFDELDNLKNIKIT